MCFSCRIIELEASGCSVPRPPTPRVEWLPTSVSIVIMSGIIRARHPPCATNRPGRGSGRFLCHLPGNDWDAKTSSCLKMITIVFVILRFDQNERLDQFAALRAPGSMQTGKAFALV